MSLLDVVAKITLDSSGYEKGLSSASKITQGFGEKLGNGLKTAAKAGAVAIGAAATAVTALATKSVKSYSQYEQLKGGVEKLFGSSANQIMKYANKAYETAGMSANQYMEQATSFSASLINSLGGDTKKAAKQTDVAMRAMSDNVNVFGSNMQDVQNAFQGFAKQNYTMLDNLKLGYGGTKQEMQRLIDDANKYAKSIGMAADLSINSFSDIITAIDLIQQKQHIAGTTSKEAAKTIEGSFNALKASWENLVTGFANKNADVSKLTKIVADKAMTAFKNILPVAKQAFIGIGQAIEEVAPIIGNKLPKVINDVLPSATKAISSLLKSIGSALPGLVTTLTPTVIKTVQSVFTNLWNAFPNMIKTANSLMNAGIEIVSKLGDGISKNFSKLIPIAMNLITNFSEKLREGDGKLVDAGLKLIMSLADGLIKNIPTLIKTVPKIISNLAGIINDNAPKLIVAGAEIVSQLASGISKNFSKIIPIAMNLLVKFSENLRSGAGKLVDAGLKLIMSLADGIIKNIPTLIKTVPTIISNLAGIINDNAPKLIVAGATLIVKLAKGIIDAIPTLIKEIPKILKAVVDVWTALSWLSLGKTLITGIVNGVKNAIPNVTNGMKTVGTKAIEAFKAVDWAGIGTKVIGFIKNAATTAGTGIVNALKTIGTKAINAFKSVDWANVGKAAINFIKNAASNAGSNVVNALKTIGTKAINAFKSVDWANVGKAAINFIAKAARGALDIVKSALTYVGNQAKSAFTSIDWAELGRNVVRGISGGIAGLAREAYNAAKSMAQGVLNTIAGTFDEHSPSKETEKQAKYLVEGIIVGINNNKKYAKKSSEELARIVLNESEKRLKTEKVLKNLSIADEVVYWDVIKSSIQSGTQARLDAEKRYLETKKKVNESIISDAEQQLNNRKVYNNVSYKEEADYWDKIRKLAQKGTQARVDADSKYRESLKSYREEIKNTISAASNLSSAFANQFEEINNSLEKSISDLRENYKKAVSDRANAITSSLSVIDAFKAADLPTYSEIVGYDEEGKAITKDVTANANILIGNLQSQVKAIKEWNSILDNLENRLGGKTPLLKEFESMGVESYKTLEQINSMTDEQLNTYVKLYNQRAKEAKIRAKTENEDLKEQTKEDIRILKEDAKTKISELKNQYKEDLRKLATEANLDGKTVGESITKGVSKGLKETSDTIKNAAQSISNKILSAKSEAKNSGNSIGKSIADGMAQGLKNSQSIVTNMAREVARNTEKSARKELKINSPSKKFAWIGKMVDEGLALGINKNSNSVDTAVENLSNITKFPTASDWGTATATVPSSAIGNNTTTITMNIYGAQGQDVKALADEVERRLNAKVTRGGIAFA